MEKENPMSLEQLKAELEEITHKITELDSKGDKGQEWNQLHNRHEELTRMIEEAPIDQDLDKAA